MWVCGGWVDVCVDGGGMVGRCVCVGGERWVGVCVCGGVGG